MKKNYTESLMICSQRKKNASRNSNTINGTVKPTTLLSSFLTLLST